MAILQSNMLKVFFGCRSTTWVQFLPPTTCGSMWKWTMSSAWWSNGAPHSSWTTRSSSQAAFSGKPGACLCSDRVSAPLHKRASIRPVYVGVLILLKSWLCSLAVLRLARWQFATESADIGFGVFLKDRKGAWQKAAQMQEVVPNQRYNAHLVPEDGSLTCERPGVCEWDATCRSITSI